MDTLTALTDPVLTTVRRAVDEATKSVAEENKKTMRTFLADPCPFRTYDTIVESSGAQILDAD